MKIAVNTRLLLKDKLDGIGRFSLETLKIITRNHPECQFYFLFDRPYDPAFLFADNITPLVLFPQARHPALFYYWFEYSVPSALKKIQPDLFLSPDGYLCLKTGVRSLPVIHDLNFEHYPKDIPFLNRLFYRYFFPKYAKKAARIATVSEFSKKEIEDIYEIEEDKIDVIYNGASEIFNPVSEKIKLETHLKYTNGSEYFLFVSSILPRKNLKNLFKAFDLFKSAKETSVKLLLVGQKIWWTNELESNFQDMVYKNEVVFTGRLSEDELFKVMSSALALTYVSYYEGFGIPIIEAFKCEVPVIASGISAIPEIAGDAAFFVDPFSPESIANAMSELYSNKKLGVELIAKGKVQEQKFSWEKTADKLWNSISLAIDQ